MVHGRAAVAAVAAVWEVRVSLGKRQSCKCARGLSSSFCQVRGLQRARSSAKEVRSAVKDIFFALHFSMGSEPRIQWVETLRKRQRQLSMGIHVSARNAAQRGREASTCGAHAVRLHARQEPMRMDFALDNAARIMRSAMRQ